MDDSGGEDGSTIDVAVPTPSRAVLELSGRGAHVHVPGRSRGGSATCRPNPIDDGIVEKAPPPRGLPPVEEGKNPDHRIVHREGTGAVIGPKYAHQPASCPFRTKLTSNSGTWVQAPKPACVEAAAIGAKLAQGPLKALTVCGAEPDHIAAGQARLDSLSLRGFGPPFVIPEAGKPRGAISRLVGAGDVHEPFPAFADARSRAQLRGTRKAPTQRRVAEA